MGFSRQEYWSGLPFSSPEDLSNPETEPRSPALEADSLPSDYQGSPRSPGNELNNFFFLKKFAAYLFSPHKRRYQLQGHFYQKNCISLVEKEIIPDVAILFSRKSYYSVLRK